MARPRGFNTYLEWDRGFRGWLVVWFAITVLSLIAHLVSLVGVGRAGIVWWSAADGNLWLYRTVVVIDVLWVISVFVGLVYGLGLFFREDRDTPRFWSRFYIAIAAFGSAIYVLHAYRIGRLHADSLGAVLAEWGWWRLASAVVVPVAWALYWIRSKRVQNTYIAR